MTLMKKIFIIFFLNLFILQQNTLAYVKIINIPSTDVTPSGKINLQEGTRFNPFQKHEFVNGTPAISYGTKHDAEIFLGVPIGSEKDLLMNNLNSRIAIFTGVKKRFNPTETTKIALGFQIAQSLQSFATPANFEFVLVSQKIKITGSRFTSGFYLRNTRKNFIPKVSGVMLGFEQTIIPEKVIFAVDWTSRNESYGILVPGFIIKPTPTFTFKNGVLIPNGSKANFGFIITMSKTF